MKHLKQLLTRPLREVPSKAVILLLIVAVIGFADAAYLSFEHYQGVIPPCSLTSGCEQVLTSSYSTVAGIPVSLGGAIYYFLVALGAFIYLESKYAASVKPHHEKFLRYALLVTILGFIASLWFVYIQIFVIHSYCVYCLGSAITSTILFVTACVILKKYRQ